LEKTLADLGKERTDAGVYRDQNKSKAGVEEAYQEAILGITRVATEATNRFKTQWIDAIDQIAGNFSGKFGEAIGGIAKMLNTLRNQGTSQDSSLFGGIAKLFGGKVDDAYKDQGQNSIGSLSSALSDPLKSLSGGFSDFKKMFTDPGQGGFANILGKGLAKAGAGVEMGTMADGLLKAFGLKSSKTGAQIGGGIGGLVGGPIGSFLGGALGGLVGGLFTKPKYGTASLTGPGASVISGRGSAEKSAATGAAGSVQDGLAKLASELGGAVGNYSVAIGQYDGKWRVRDDAYSGELKFKGASQNGLHDFGKDGQADAIAYAIKNAVADGAITGLAPIIQKALSGLGADAAVQFAKDWTAAMSDYKSMIDPIGAAVDAIIKPMDALKDTMVKVGAGTEDMAKFEDYRSKKLNAALKEQVSGFQDILSQLNGDAGGFSDYTQLTNKMAQLGQYQADVSSGKTVDQSAYTSLANDIISKLGSVYGTNTKDYQDGIAALRTTTSGALDNATRAFNTAAGNTDVVNALKAQTDAYTAQQAQTNTLMAQNNALLVQQNAILTAKLGVSGNGGPSAYNARLVADY
jgi:hypothetical protein